MGICCFACLWYKDLKLLLLRSMKDRNVKPLDLEIRIFTNM